MSASAGAATSRSVAAPKFRPVVGRSLPATVVRVILVVIMALLCITVIGWQLALAVGLLFALAAIVFPTTPAAWLLAALLAVFTLGGYHQVPDWKFFVVLAGGHLLHLAGMTLRWLPISGPVQLRVLGRILRRFVIVQVPAQLASYFVLTVIAGRSVRAALTSPVFGLAAAVGLVLLVVAVIVPMARGDREPN